MRKTLGVVSINGRAIRVILQLFSIAGIFLIVRETAAIPQYARQTGNSCARCHIVAPKLSLNGEEFLAKGYRFEDETASDDTAKSLLSHIPLSVWITTRHEEQLSRDFSETYLPKVELISGGPIAKLPLSYFVEWRIVSQQTRNDGTLLDRGGRFEDVILNWQINDRHALRVGQFRALNQYDVSRRLSVSEPSIFSASLPGEAAADPRIFSLRAFSPSGRSPGFAYTFQSMKGELTSDGLFHTATLPFVGELSLPLSKEARDAASFELEGPPKGVFLETFYRVGLNSIGVHGFIDDDRWLATLLGMANYKDFYGAVGFGVDDRENATMRKRYSLEVEYLPTWHRNFRSGAGFRVEYISNANGDPAYIPYLVMTGPNTTYTLQLQLEFRIQENNRAIFLDLSAMF